MDKRTAIKILDAIREDDVEVNQAIDIAIECMKREIKTVQRWKTYNSNKEFWNAIDSWTKDEGNMGKNLDDLTNWLMEEVEI